MPSIMLYCTIDGFLLSRKTWWSNWSARVYYISDKWWECECESRFLFISI